MKSPSSVLSLTEKNESESIKKTLTDIEEKESEINPIAIRFIITLKFLRIVTHIQIGVDLSCLHKAVQQEYFNYCYQQSLNTGRLKFFQPIRLETSLSFFYRNKIIAQLKKEEWRDIRQPPVKGCG